VEIRDLDYFLVCSKTANFTAAARQAHIVQSAMSAAIARLEKDLGVSLFDRSVSPIALTEHGTAFKISAQRILDDVQAARDDLAAIDGSVHGTVVLGSTLNTGPLDLAAVLADTRRRHPHVTIHLRQSTAGSAGNLRALLDGSLDIALTADLYLDAPHTRFTLHPLAAEGLVFVCRPDHPYAGCSHVTVQALADEQILRFPPGWGVRNIIDQVLGDTPHAIEVADYTLMAKLIRNGFGTALMPASAAQGHRTLIAVAVDDPRMRWSLSAAVSTERRATTAANVVLDALIRAGHGAVPETDTFVGGTRQTTRADLPDDDK
jgi:DNA-binding transcriptional LysR family regulator